MGSSFACLHVHVVFATRERRLTIHQDWRLDLHKYLAGTLTGLGAAALAADYCSLDHALGIGIAQR